MKCLKKFDWVKLSRYEIPLHAKGIMIYFLRLASRAAFRKGKKSDFDKLLIDKLPGSMTEKQKKDKVRNLLAALRAAEVIKTDSPNHQISNWILNK